MKTAPIYSRLRAVIVSMASGLVLLLLGSCSTEELQVQQNFPFELRVMPVPSEMANGQTVEIRISIHTEGEFRDAAYYIRYFQFEGQGNLCYYGEQPYQPNDHYVVPEKQFRLYYTSLSSVKQSFEVWISDNFGNEKNIRFDFNTSD